MFFSHCDSKLFNVVASNQIVYRFERGYQHGLRVKHCEPSHGAGYGNIEEVAGTIKALRILAIPRFCLN